ncbi:MAG: alanine--tRNA ligase [Thiotrichales bacterium]
MQTTAEIRRSFLDFFAAKGHEIVASSPLVPANDPTLLFTNAGMVQFKEVFLGTDPRPYHRAVSVQRCMRAGGKHNDLENVGYTARHHTFFEMLGNFSFGDYFKTEAIAYAWEYLTVVLGLPAERLWVTVYQDDAEAAEVWLDQIKVDPARFSRIGDKRGGKRYESDNFWTMGDTGPCGPCTEIFYDHGAGILGGPPGTPEEDGDRYIEIWNLVFMQYDRNAAGELKPLPKPSVDTGMGLERLAAILQGVHGNYEIDLFRALIAAAAAATGASDLGSASLKVIADHIRACSFLIADGVLPANEGRGYVLRRIIRRAARHGHKLGQNEPFLHGLVAPLVAEMGAAYPELGKGQAHIERVLRQEEQRFAETLDKGMGLLQEAISGIEGDTLAGETVFKLYDTFGFPVDLTADVAREHGLKLDMDGFETAMGGQREQSRASSQFAVNKPDMAGLAADLRSEFLGYESVSSAARVIALLRDGAAVSVLEAGDDGVVILDRTPFYAESGGQVGDQGALSTAASAFTVRDTQKRGHAIAHVGGVANGRIAVGDTVRAEVDGDRRQAIVLNHSATHLMHAALRTVLGDHVQQKGSLVTPERLRFDFSHYEPMTREQISTIERIVNDEIRANADTAARVMSMDAALATGAMALFGEKYGDEVRVVNIGFSTELCGGTHVRRAGDIGVFRILSEGGVAAGVRRIEATTGAGALGAIERDAQSLRRVAGMLKSDAAGLETRVAQLVAREKELEREIEQLNARLAARAGDELVSQAVEVAGIKVLAANIDGVDPKSLRDTVDQLKQKLGRAAIVLATVQQGKVSLVAGVTADETRRVKAGDLINVVAQQVGGRGGGRPDMAQAGGNDPTQLDAALQGVPAWVEARLAGN